MESAPRTPERDDERYPDERHILPQPYVEVKTNETMKQLQPPAQPPVEATEKKKDTNRLGRVGKQRRKRDTGVSLGRKPRGEVEPEGESLAF